MTSPERKKSIQRWALWLAVAIPVAAVIIYLLIWCGPDVIARHDIGNVTGPLRVLRLQQARDAARGRLLTLGAGLFAAGALVFTAWNLTLYRHTNELSEQGQVTDRYTKAIEQLGSDKIDVRIGGIYALERVARDSRRDHPTVMEVLAAFIREHSRERWPVPESDDASVPERSTRPDVQAAITVIGRRDATRDRDPINLHGANLTRADLSGAGLKDTYLGSVDLTGARLSTADLRNAGLAGAIFRDAYLLRVDLRDAYLRDADLTGARLPGADLRNADLTAAKLTNASPDLSSGLMAGAGRYLDRVAGPDFSVGV